MNEAEFYFWLNISDEVKRDEALLRVILTSHAVWDPKKALKLIDDKRPMTKERAEDSIRKAEEINKKTKFIEGSIEEV